MLDLSLTLPTDEGCVTFDMRNHKLIVRLEPRSMQTIFVIAMHGPVLYSIKSTQRNWSSALVNVGKFLADNPSF